MTDTAQSPYKSTSDAVLTPLSEASRRQGLSGVADSLKSLRDWLADDLNQLETDLANSVQEQRTLSQKAAVHLLGSKGKRIRPLVTLLCSRMSGNEPEVARHLAVACELVHAATLLHDDVLDQGTERRGDTTARVIYGNSASVLGGDHLLLESLRRVRLTKNNDLLDRLIEVIESMVVAEALQLDRRDRFEPSREKYMDVAEGKTAVLFSWGMYAGATVGGATEEDAKRLWEVGRYLGLAFQAVDDCLDLAPGAEGSGKNLFVDIAEGKLTLPLIIACKKNAELIGEIEAVASGAAGAADDSDAMLALVERIRETGCLEEARAEARGWSDEGLKTLAEVQESPARDALATVIAAAVERLR